MSKRSTDRYLSLARRLELAANTASDGDPNAARASLLRKGTLPSNHAWRPDSPAA